MVDKQVVIVDRTGRYEDEVDFIVAIALQTLAAERGGLISMNNERILKANGDIHRWFPMGSHVHLEAQRGEYIKISIEDSSRCKHEENEDLPPIGGVVQ